jgi:hypothetical protein
LFNFGLMTMNRRPKQKHREATPPSLDEAAALMAAASKDKWSCLWLLILALAVRRGEALGLRWADVDFDSNTIRVREVVQRLRGEPDPVTGQRKGRLVTKDPKTDASERTLPAPAATVTVRVLVPRATVTVPAPRPRPAVAVFATSPDSSGQLFGPDRLTSAEIAARALEQMGEPPMPGYAAHRRAQYGLSPVDDLLEQMGI